MPVSKYLNQRVRRIGEQNGKSFKGFPKKKEKKKKEKKQMKWLNYISQFKIDFLLTIACCTKVFGKMPANNIY